MYLHCHSCNWSQDDFWEWKWKGLLSFWKFKSRPFGYNPFSLLLQHIAVYFEIKRIIKRIKHMRWWTYNSWLIETHPVCPECGDNNFGID